MLLPVLNKARTQARKTECANHLQQTGQMLALYLDNYRGMSPLNADANPGVFAIQAITKSIFPGSNPLAMSGSVRIDNFKILTCPARTWEGDSMRTSYGMNPFIYQTQWSPNAYSTQWKGNLYLLRKPSQTFTFCDLAAPQLDCNSTIYIKTFIFTPANTTKWVAGFYRHPGNSTNLVFADGHVGSIMLKFTQDSEFRPYTGRDY